MKIKNSLFAQLLKKLLHHSVPEIDVENAFLQKEQFTFLDAREYAEFELSHIKDAHHVGYKNFNTDRLPKLDLSNRIVVYCSVGYRSEKIAEKLSILGYKNVQNLYGGIFEWHNQGYRVVNSSGVTTDIHPYNAAWGVWLSKK